MSEQHRGAAPSGPLTPKSDPRVNELDLSLRGLEAALFRHGSTTFGPLRDVTRALIDAGTPVGEHYRGVVIHPIAALGWYKVQVAGIGAISCYKIGGSGFIPLGPREIGGIPPNSIVVVYKPSKAPLGFILGVEPPQTLDGSLPNPDWLFQGGQSGYRREDVHKHPMKNTYRGGHIGNMAGQRPCDSTSMEQGWISSTGIAVSIDDAMAQMRVNEQCGLFMTIFDGWCRLAGMQLDIESLIHEEKAREDEGEARLFRGIAAYPWEALGMYDVGAKYTKVYSNHEVQYDKPVGKVDVDEDKLDVEPMYRYQEYGGYLGQGHHRLVALPAKPSGLRQRKNAQNETDEGLFAETIGLDGEYALRSAKGVLIAKRCKIIVPREKKLPEDGLGDDGQADNYKFSSRFGAGEDHKLKEVQIDGEYKSLRRISAVDDMIAHMVNWKALHPFHYHKLDYRTKQESEQSEHFTRVQELLNFSELQTQPFLTDPTPKKLKIDHRYRDVEYFERESFMYLAPDGSVMLASGQGAALVLTSDVRIEAPGDVQLAPGRDLVSFADQTILRSRGSVDISTMKDLRLKSEFNMQLLAANSRKGGLLLESKSVGRTQLYEKRFGEKVVANGIVFKSAGVLASIAADHYVRSTTGDIILDANRGRRDLLFKGRNLSLFAQKEVAFFYGPIDDSSAVNKTYRFGAKNCLINARLNVGGRIISFSGAAGNGGVTVDGRISCTGGIAAGGRMADRKGGMIGKIPDGVTSAISAATSAAAQLADVANQLGQSRHEGLVTKYYQNTQPGHLKTIENIGFSYRDVKGDGQYGTSQFKWLERRWEQMRRFGLASGGVAWIEKPVLYQGEQLHPWPGRRKWQEDPAFLQLNSLTMFDASAGQSKDRPYEEPKLSDWTPTTMASGFKLIRAV